MTSLILVTLFGGRSTFAAVDHGTTRLTLKADNSSVGGNAFLSGVNSYNSYNGDTVIDGGILILANGGTLGANSGTTTICNGGTLDLGGTTQTQALIEMNDASIFNGCISNTELLFTGGSNNVSANILGASSVVSAGGINTLAGTNNNYTGGTFITNTLLTIANGSSLGSSNNALYMSAGARLDLGGNTVLQNNVTLTGYSCIHNGSLYISTLTSRAIGTNFIEANIEGTNATVRSDSGNMVLLGNNSYTGTTLIAGGTMCIESSHALGNSTVDLTGGNLDLGRTTNLSIQTLNWTNSSSVIELFQTGSSVITVDRFNCFDGMNYFSFTDGTADNQSHLIMVSSNGVGDLSKFGVVGKNPGEYEFSTNNDGTQLSVRLLTNPMSGNQNH
ncbi:MAG: hypothetical protein FJ390_06405 [Verrucomicrobia bacterium]|nr:hypothetical protein [Verrucomicrobiota bacterium]